MLEYNESGKITRIAIEVPLGDLPMQEVQHRASIIGEKIDSLEKLLGVPIFYRQDNQRVFIITNGKKTNLVLYIAIPTSEALQDVYET